MVPPVRTRAGTTSALSTVANTALSSAAFTGSTLKVGAAPARLPNRNREATAITTALRMGTIL